MPDVAQEQGTLQLALFPDISVRPTIAMQRGDSFLAQCGYCGLLVCVPGVGVDGSHRGATTARQLGACPSCRRDQGWWQQEPGVGPFKPRSWPLDDVVARCPQCGLEWTETTRLSWWLRYDRCYSCMHTPDADTFPSADELAPFALDPNAGRDDWSPWDDDPVHPETDGFDFHPDPSIDEETTDG